jgi:disulfide bond formation protein DsbB
MKRLLHLAIASFLISAFVLTACGGNKVESPPQDSSQAEGGVASKQDGDVSAGQKKFEISCSACHGPAGEGVAGLGKDMTTSEFIAGKSDDELVAFIEVGRDPGDPLNTTGVAMPPKGGNPALSDEDLYNVVAFVRSLQK